MSTLSQWTEFHPGNTEGFSTYSWLLGAFRFLSSFFFFLTAHSVGIVSGDTAGHGLGYTVPECAENG